MLPARREISVKVRLRWLKEQSSIDRARTTDGATDEGVHPTGATGQAGGAGKDGIVESGYVDAAQVGAHQPLRSLGASSDAVGGPTSLEQKDFSCPTLTQPAGHDDSRRTGTDYNYIP